MIGQVLKIPFPYVQKKGFKVRPAVLINEVPGHMICAAISSKGILRTGDVYLEDWKTAGLFLPSKVKVMMITTFSIRNLEMAIPRIGFLSDRDYKKVMKEFKVFWEKGGLLDEQSNIAV